MQSKRFLIAVVGLVVVVVAGVIWYASGPGGQPADGLPTTAPATQGRDYVGAASCRECHERFHGLWAKSHHGLAMQPFTADLGRAGLPLNGQAVKIGANTYRAELDGEAGLVRQSGPDGEKTFNIAHVMGGKNVYYALTPLTRGRLQVLPIAYDVGTKRWYDMAASGVRHFPGAPEDAPLPWTDAAFTFNTSCYSCHVSQLETNYDAASDSYRTTWAEPGINCETCHGPASEHVRVCKAAPKAQPPKGKDLKILRYEDFTVAQSIATCAPCHARMSPITTGFKPGERYFDHYDLTSLENSDFHPDGRDLGENYTFTSWRMSPCVKSGKLSCIHCHTSSGRYRFGGDKANNACLPCHAKRVANATKHTRHLPEKFKDKSKKAPVCISCHMPTTRFAQMSRSDHSMRPPTPSATIAWKSPNACNLCHTSKKEDAEWADGHVRKWHTDDYQKPVLDRAALIADARSRKWKRLDEMLARISDPKRDEMYAVGMIRLLTECPDQRKVPVLIGALSDPSPLVRSSATDVLGRIVAPAIGKALIGITRDDSRLVRIRAANVLASYPRRFWSPAELAALDRAFVELETSFAGRPDGWASHYNRGNYLSARGNIPEALMAYERATKLRPDALMPLVNASMLYARAKRMDKAEQLLLTALRHAPNNAAANFNMGLLLVEKSDLKGAERHLRAAFKADPTMAQAAYNLGVMLYKSKPADGVMWCRRAAKLNPQSSRYAWTLAYYLDLSGNADEAAAILMRLVEAGTRSPDIYDKLISIYRKQGKLTEARAICQRLLNSERFNENVKAKFRAILKTLQ